MIATTTEATVVSDAVTTEVRTGRGAQVAFLRNGRLAFLTLNSTTVDVSGADDVLSRRYQPRLLLGTSGAEKLRPDGSCPTLSPNLSDTSTRPPPGWSPRGG